MIQVLGAVFLVWACCGIPVAVATGNPTDVLLWPVVIGAGLFRAVRSRLKEIWRGEQYP